MTGTKSPKAVGGQTINRIARISERAERQIALREAELGAESHKAALKLGKTPTREQTLEYSREVQKYVKGFESEKYGALGYAAERILETHFLSGNPLHRALMLSLLNGVHNEMRPKVKIRDSPADASTRRYDIGLGTNFRDLDAEAFGPQSSVYKPIGDAAPDLMIAEVAKELRYMRLVGWFKDHPVYIRLTPVGEAAIDRWGFLSRRRVRRSELGPVIQIQRREETAVAAGT